MNEAIAILLEKGGLLGALFLLSLWTIYRQHMLRESDRREFQLALAQEHERRVDDQKAATKAMLEMSDKTHNALDKVGDVLEAVRHAPAQPYRASTTGTKTQP